MDTRYMKKTSWIMDSKALKMDAALDKAVERLTGKSRSELETVIGSTVGLRTPQKRAMYQVAMAMLGRGVIPSHPLKVVA